MFGAPSHNTGGTALIAQLRRTALGEDEQFSLFTAPTPLEATRHADTTAAIHGHSGAFRLDHLLHATAPMSDLPTLLGGASGVRLPPGLRAVLAPREPPPPPRESASTDTPLRALRGLSPPPGPARSLHSELRHEGGGGDDPEAEDDGDDEGRAPSATGEGDEGECRIPSATGEESRNARAAALNAATRNQATRTIIEFLAHYPLCRAALHPDGEDAPAAACRLLPLDALVVITGTLASQHYGLLMVINTLARQRDAYGKSSRLAAELMSSVPACDAAGARYMLDGTVVVPTSSPLERLVNYIPVGAIARAIAMTFFIHGSPAKAEALYTAAERFFIIAPGTGPNTLDFTTLAQLARAIRAANSAGTTVDCDRVVRCIARAILSFEVLVHLGRQPGARHLRHRRAYAAPPAHRHRHPRHHRPRRSLGPRPREDPGRAPYRGLLRRRHLRPPQGREGPLHPARPT